MQVAGFGQLFDNPILGAATVVVGSDAELLPPFAVASPPPATLALFVTLAAALPAILTVNVKTLVLLPAIFEIAVELVQVMICGAAAFELQAQFAAFAPLMAATPTKPPLTESPVGKVSVTVIAAEVGAVPALVRVIV